MICFTTTSPITLPPTSATSTTMTLGLILCSRHSLAGFSSAFSSSSSWQGLVETVWCASPCGAIRACALPRTSSWSTWLWPTSWSSWSACRRRPWRTPSASGTWAWRCARSSNTCRSVILSHNIYFSFPLAIHRTCHRLDQPVRGVQARHEFDPSGHDTNLTVLSPAGMYARVQSHNQSMLRTDNIVAQTVVITRSRWVTKVHHEYFSSLGSISSRRLLHTLAKPVK